MNVYELVSSWMNAKAAEAAIKQIPSVIAGAPTAAFTPPVTTHYRTFALHGSAYAGSIAVQEAGVPVANTAYSVYKITHTVAMCSGNIATIGRDDGIVAVSYQPVTVFGASAVSLSTPTSAVPFALDFATDPSRIDVYDYYGMYNHGHPVGYDYHSVVTAWISYRGMMLPARQLRLAYY